MTGKYVEKWLVCPINGLIEHGLELSERLMAVNGENELHSSRSSFPLKLAGPRGADDLWVSSTYTQWMPFDIDIAHVARLARLGLSDAELTHYQAQLGLILDHAARVQEFDTDGVEPTAHPLSMVNAFRPDEVRPSLAREEVLDQSPEHEDGYFRVPPHLETQ